MPQPLYPWDRDPLPILQEPGWVSEEEREWRRKKMFQEAMLNRILVYLNTIENHG